MTAKEYLSQAYRLDQRIDSDIEELDRLHELSRRLSCPAGGEKVQTSVRNDAPFVGIVNKIIDLENHINREIDALVNLKNEMRGVIDAVANADEKMVLRYRYVHGYTWRRVSSAIHADAHTVRRWHEKALSHVVLPKNPTVI